MIDLATSVVGCSGPTKDQPALVTRQISAVAFEPALRAPGWIESRPAGAPQRLPLRVGSCNSQSDCSPTSVQNCARSFERRDSFRLSGLVRLLTTNPCAHVKLPSLALKICIPEHLRNRPRKRRYRCLECECSPPRAGCPAVRIPHLDKRADALTWHSGACSWSMQSFIVTPGRFMHSVLRRQSRSDSAISLQLRPCEGAGCERCTGRRERDHTRHAELTARQQSACAALCRDR